MGGFKSKTTPISKEEEETLKSGSHTSDASLPKKINMLHIS